MRPTGAQQAQELIQMRGSSCNKYKDEQVKLFCYECNENICVLCFAVKHRQHDTAEIPEVAKMFSKQINSDAQLIWSLIHSIQEKTLEKQKKRTEFMRQTDRVISEIRVTGNRVKEVIDNQVG